MDSSANILLASGELLEYLDNELVYQDQADVGAEMILEQVSNSVQKQVWNVGIQGHEEVIIITSRHRNASIVVFAPEST